MRSADILPQRQLSQPATRPVVSSPSRRLAWLAGAVGVVLTALAFRLPYLNVPISADEGGYAAMVVQASRPLGEYTRIGVTTEPRGGSPGPTSGRVIGADLSRATQRIN